MNSLKVEKSRFSSFRRKPESSQIKRFWTPAFAGVTVFTKPSILVFAEDAGVCRPHGPPQKTPRLRQRPRGFENLLTGSVGRLCRGALSPGAFWQYLSGYAAVETAGEEIAAAHADGRPHRDSM
jgi:hypothetical protein